MNTRTILTSSLIVASLLSSSGAWAKKHDRHEHRKGHYQGEQMAKVI